MNAATMMLDMNGESSRRRKLWQMLLAAEDVPTWDGEAPGRPGRKPRTQFKPQPRSGDPGAAEPMHRWRCHPERDSHWTVLITNPFVYDESSYTGRKFRRKFRLPRKLVDDLCELAQRKEAFVDKPGGPGCGKGPPRHPFLYKLLGTLMMLGKGVDAETAAEAAQLANSSMSRFFKEITEWLGTEVYTKEVRIPTGIELTRALSAYELQGFPGACCSVDGVHWPWDACPAVRRWEYVGKEGYPTFAFNVAVLMTREIVHVSRIMGGRVNDMYRECFPFAWLSSTRRRKSMQCCCRPSSARQAWMRMTIRTRTRSRLKASGEAGASSRGFPTHLHRTLSMTFSLWKQMMESSRGSPCATSSLPLTTMVPPPSPPSRRINCSR